MPSPNDAPQARSEKKLAGNSADGPAKYGWRVAEWSRAVPCSRSYTNVLIKEGRIDSVKLGRNRIILTHPADYLASLRGGGK